MSTARPPRAGLSRKHLARAERDALLQRWVIVGAVAVSTLVAGLLGYGWLDQNVLQPRQPVARVGTVEITTLDFQKAVRNQRLQLINQYMQISQLSQLFGGDPNTQQFYESQLSQIQIQLGDPTTLGRQVLNGMIDDEIIRQEAARRGITIPAEEVDKALQEAFGYYASGTPTPRPTATFAPTDTPTAAPTGAPTITPTATLAPTFTPTAGPSPTPLPSATPYTFESYQKDYNDFLARLKAQTGMTEADIRKTFQTNLLRQKVLEALTADTPRQITEAHARHILVSDRVAAQALIDQLKKGADFAQLAAAHSIDTATKDAGGDLGTFAQGRMVAPFDKVVFSADLGLYPEPVQTDFGYHVIEILSRGTRQMTDSEYTQKQRQVFDNWLAGQRSNSQLVAEFDYWQLRVPVRPTIDEIAQGQRTPQP